MASRISVSILLVIVLFSSIVKARNLAETNSRECGDLPTPPPNARIVYDDVWRPRVACDDGYFLTANAVIRCNKETGKWDMPATCRAKSCGNPGKPENGIKIGYLYNYGYNVSFKCNDCFYLDGQETRTCLANQSWSGELPTCQPINCGRVVDDWKLENGYVFGQDTYCGSTIQFGCNEGFRLNGTDSITCNKDGKWTGVKPSCYLAYCKESDAEIPAGGARFGRNDIGHSLHFFCQDDKRLVGAPSVRCQENGKWSDKAPACKPICEDISCGTAKQCVVNKRTKQPQCVCEGTMDECYDKDYEPVCGSDGVTYNNECVMRVKACIANKEVTVVRRDRCVPGGICAIKPESQCRAAFPVYYYDHKKKSCKLMIAGGCHKSGWNGFDSLQQCKQTCQVSKTDGALCTRLADPGPCNAVTTRWYHNATLGICQQFKYGGCYGNQNNFLTEEDCNNVCPKATRKGGLEPPPTLEQAEKPYGPTATTVSMVTTEPEIAAKATVAPEEEVVTAEWTSPIPAVEPTRSPVFPVEEKKQCPPCKRKPDLCENIYENHYVLVGKKVREDESAVILRVNEVFQDKKNKVKAGKHVNIIKLISDKKCSCLPDFPPGKVIISGNYIVSGDEIVLSYGEEDFVGTYFGLKQLMNCEYKIQEMNP